MIVSLFQSFTREVAPLFIPILFPLLDSQARRRLALSLIQGAPRLFDGFVIRPWDGTVESLLREPPSLIWLPNNHPGREEALKEAWGRGHFVVSANRALGSIRIRGKVFDLSTANVYELLGLWQDWRVRRQLAS